MTLGLAGAGAVVGTVFGVMALKSKSDFNKSPTTDNADKTDRNALISDMSFAVAITFGVTGAVLLLSRGEAAPERAAPPPPGAPAKNENALKKTAMPRGFIAPWGGPNGGGAVGVLQF